jgi:hydrogenase-4 component E
MNIWVDMIMVLLVLTNLMLLGSSRLTGCIRLIAIQGIVLGLLPLMIHNSTIGAHVIILSVAAIAMKAVVFPWLLFRALRDADVRREVEPFVGYTLSVIIGVSAFVGSVWVSTKLPVVNAEQSSLVVPVALAMVLIGLFIIISRRKALAQVLGYLVLENGT